MAALRVGLIGVGAWGRKILDTAKALSVVEVRRAASRDPGAAGLLPEGRVSKDWRELTRDPDVDAIIVAAASPLHYEMTRAALSSGRHVFVEKPLTLDAAQADELCELAEKKRLVGLVDHVHLFNPAFQALRHAATALSKPRSIESSAGNWGPFRPDTPPLWDWGPHDIAMCLDIQGKAPLGVSAFLEQSRKEGDGLGQIMRLRLRFDRLDADIRVGNLLERRQRRFELKGEKEALIFDDSSGIPLQRRRADGGLEAIEAPRTPPLRCALEAFASAVASGRAERSDLRLGAEVVRVLAQCERQLRGSSA